MNKYDLIVYIGRFQPFHNAHKKTIQHASNLSRNVLVLVGSANSPRSPKNPFTYEERVEMINNSTNILNMQIKDLKDFKYDTANWIKEVGDIVSETIDTIDKNEPKVAIIGYDKDHSSFYLNYFPQWDFIPMLAYPNHGETIDATKVRNLIFNKEFIFIGSVVPKQTYKFIDDWTKQSIHFDILLKEWKYVQDYKKSWQNSPYPPTFVTTDAVVVQSGHVLLIKRKNAPGKGMWAIPGGFLNENETIREGLLRELKEETQLKVPLDVLSGSVVAEQVFDDPTRSERGRTITHASLVKLKDNKELPKVKGSDDASEARWFSFSEFEHMETEMFEDHYFIVEKMLNLL